MPLAPGGRYRVKKTKSGKKIRLHFNKRGKVDEAKKIGGGGMERVLASHIREKRFGKNKKY